MSKLTEDEQRAIIGKRLSDTLSTSNSELRQDREKALDFYYGRPMGNEIEGRAQVVSKDMMDTIEWMMPSLLRIFATKDAVQFDPVGPEDEELAKQETEYVTHVLWKKNAGFMLLYNWIKDGLMQKVGYIKTQWNDEKKISYDSYAGLSDEQLVLTMQSLQQDGEVDVVGHSQEEDGSHSIRVRIKKKYGCAKIDNVPPEEVIVDAKCRGTIKEANFVGHLRKLTRSDLIGMGYKRKDVTDLTDYRHDVHLETTARDTVNENIDQVQSGADWATYELTLLECYTYLDVDDDGMAELRHYLMGGNDILENEEFSDIPFDSWTPIPVPHRHVGLSIYDIMEDLQRIKTALQRGLLDNVYFTNNPRNVYDKTTIDVASLQINRPGGHVANNGPVLGSIMPMPVNPMAGQLLPVIDYMDNVKENRTGVGRMTSGVDADVLSQSTKGAYINAQSAANQRIEAIARIFAETGLSSLYASLHKLLSHHQDWETRFKLKSKWVTVNPTEWEERADLSVSVGLGNSSRDEVRQNLMTMASAQQQAAQVPGLIQPQDVYNLFVRIQTELGFEMAKFATDPSSDEYKQFIKSQPQPTDPNTSFLQAQQLKSSSDLQGKQIDAAVKIRGQDKEQALGIAKLEVEGHVDLAKAGIGAELATQRNAAQAARGNSGTAAQQRPAM